MCGFCVGSCGIRRSVVHYIISSELVVMEEKANDYDETLKRNQKILDQERIKKVEAINKLAQVKIIPYLLIPL